MGLFCYNKHINRKERMKLLKDLLQVKLDEMPKKEDEVALQNQWELVPNTGEVLAVTEQFTTDFKVGNKIVFNGYAVMQVNTGDEVINLIREADVLGIL